VPRKAPSEFGPVLRTVLVIELSVSNREVLDEARRWATGERGEAGPLTDLVGVDLSPFVREAIMTGVHTMRAGDRSGGQGEAD